MDMAKAITWIALSIGAIVLICIAGSRNGRPGIPSVGWPWGRDNMAEIFAWAGVWALLIVLIYCAAVDVVIWATRSDVPNVSDIIHYYLYLYPWVAWVAAGLVYHLLVNTPAPPQR